MGIESITGYIIINADSLDAAEEIAPVEREMPENITFEKEKYVCVQDAETLKQWIARG